MRATMMVVLSALAALTWYRQHLKFEDKRGVFHALSPEHGQWLLLATTLLGWGVVSAIAWREISASSGPGRPGLSASSKK